MVSDTALVDKMPSIHTGNGKVEISLITSADNLISPPIEPTSLADWAPVYKNPLRHTNPRLLHLPNPSSSPTSTWLGPTSLPIQVIQQELEFSTLSLLNIQVLKTFLSNKKSCVSFEAYLNDRFTRGSAILELYQDLRTLADASAKAGIAATGVKEIYLLSGTEREVRLKPSDTEKLVSSLSSITSAELGLETAQQCLLERLYEKEFQSYVKERLLQQTSILLGSYNRSREAVGGLGDAFVLSNPRLPDQPIVLCSPAFCKLTGYTTSEIVGRNCRFLQGKATAPSSVSNIRTALDNEEAITQLVLNYRADGTPFWNLLCILPLQDAIGNLTYFIGGQTNVTGLMSSGSDLSFLLDASNQGVLQSTKGAQNGSQDKIAYSAALKSYMERNQKGEISKPMPTKEIRNTPEPPVDWGEKGSLEASDISDTLMAKPVLSKRFRSMLNLKGHSRSPSSNQVKVKSISSGKTVTPSITTVTPSPTHHVKLPQSMPLSPAPIEQQLADFTATYEKVLIFRRESRQIIFVTASFLRFCGLGGDHMGNVYASPVLHADVLEIITKDARPRLKAAIKKGASISTPCGVGLSGHRNHLSADGNPEFASPISKGVLHLTPLQDHNNTVSAYIAVFG